MPTAKQWAFLFIFKTYRLGKLSLVERQKQRVFSAMAVLLASRVFRELPHSERLCKQRGDGHDSNPPQRVRYH